MLYRFILVLTFSLFLVHAVNGQDYRERFAKLFDAKDFKGQYALLQAWEKAAPDDPELYVSFFNHYVFKSRQETFGLTTAQPKGSSASLSKNGKVVGYLGSNVIFTKEDFDLAISYIDKGIAKFPNRLDMRFGKTYALGQIEAHERVRDEILRTLEYFGGGKNPWAWRDGTPLDKPKDFMLKAIQDYVVGLFNAGDSEAQYIKPIAEAVLRSWPDHVESLSNLSVVNMLNGKYDEALVSLKKAESIAPNDHIIIGNIAFCYYNKRDKANATAYYERLAKLGDEQAIKGAAAKLAEIKGWE